MAAIENLEIVVDVDISKAVAELSELQDELQDIADEINKVDARGTEGIDINTRLESIDDDLTVMSSKIEAWEAANSVDIDTNVDNFRGPVPGGGGGGGGSGGFDPGRYTIPNFQQGGTRADNMGELFGFMDFPGGGRDRRGGRLSRLMGKLGDEFGDVMKSIEDFDLRMSDLHNAMAKLIPLLFVFLGAIPAAITAIYGLAVAAGAAAAGLMALAGLGALGVGLQDGQFDADRLKDVMEEVRSDFIEAFAPLAERLQPLFEDAIDGLDKLFQGIANEGDALMELTDEARAFGDFILDFVPGALRDLGAMVEALAPIFGDIGQFLEREFTNIVRTLTSLTAQTVPFLADMAMQIGRMIPALVKMSIGFMQIVNIILKFVGFLGWLLGLLGVTPRAFGAVTAAVLTMATAILLARGQLIGLIVQGFLTLAGVVYSYFVPAVATIVAGFTSSAVATYIATAALASFLTLATLGAAVALVGMATSAAAGFLGLAGSIDSATSSLKEFNRVSSGSGTDGFNPYGAGTEGAGAADATAGTAAARSGGSTVINIESSGDKERDKSNASYASHQFRQGRTTGGNN